MPNNYTDAKGYTAIYPILGRYTFRDDDFMDDDSDEEADEYEVYE